MVLFGPGHDGERKLFIVLIFFWGGGPMIASMSGAH